MIEDRRAPGRRQFSEPHERGPAGRFRRTAGPDPVVGAQPRKQVIVLRSRQVARQRLVEVVVDVHKAGQDDLPGEIQHQVGRWWKLVRQADQLDDSMEPSLFIVCKVAVIKPIVHVNRLRRCDGDCDARRRVIITRNDAQHRRVHEDRRVDQARDGRDRGG